MKIKPKFSYRFTPSISYRSYIPLILIRDNPFQAPFKPRTCPFVHYVSKNDQSMAAIGIFDSHVLCYFKRPIITVDPLTGNEYSSNSLCIDETPLIRDNEKSLDEAFSMYIDSKIKAAGKRLYPERFAYDKTKKINQVRQR